MGLLKNYRYTDKDKKILRGLAFKKAEIAALPIHKEKIYMWKQLNSLKTVRPLVWINEIPWHEMNVDEELTLETSTEFSRLLELDLRKTIYQWKHMRADMVVEPEIHCQKVIDNTGFGISEKVHTSWIDKDSNIYSREFIPQIRNDEDIVKIKTPRVYYDKKSTDEKYQCMADIFSDILKVERRGLPGFWFAPWDELIRWMGIQEALTDLIIRPGFIHKIMGSLLYAYLCMLDQYENQNLLELNNCNYRIGSGGLGYTDELPQKDFSSDHVRTSDIWGCGAAQIFSEVSPKMHDEFALGYEIKWMKRFGLNYYGCCEPLDKKIEILKRIPNLRKISMSPWVNLKLGADNIGKDYVFSYKPNPAIFAEDRWDVDVIRRDLTNNLKKIKGCRVEIIMKDISTVKYKPQRLWEWAEIVMEVVAESN